MLHVNRAKASAELEGDSKMVYLKFRRSILRLTMLVSLCLKPSLSFAGIEIFNHLTWRGDGTANPAADQPIKNIIIFQIGGWAGLIIEATSQPGRSTWPLHWGMAGYLNRDINTYLWQTYEVEAISENLAIAPLLMPDAEAAASGYGVCWGGTWSASRGCVGGQWSTPLQQLPFIKYAAWMRGVQIVPFVSINNYGCLNPNCPSYDNRGDLVLPKLQGMVDQIMAQKDATYSTTPDERTIIMLEGLPQNTQLSTSNAQDIASYLGSRSDIVWIDNLLLYDSSPSLSPANVFRSAATDPWTQYWLKDIWLDRYLWHFTANRAGTSSAFWTDPANVYPEADRLAMFNIDPHAQHRYPVIISQWNEYAEWLVFEPNEFRGYDDFNYLQWRLGQQLWP